jgi:hypothetical protein
MKVEDIANNKDRFECFQCGTKISFGDKRFVVLSTEEGVIEIANPRTGFKAPMVFESSDCMVLDSHLRYLERSATGKFRKVFNQQYNDTKRLPDTFKDEAYDRQVKDFSTKTGT